LIEKNSLEERCREILEGYGGSIADKARTILLEDSALRDLRSPLGYISKNWRDPLTPALMRLSCESVGGASHETSDVALAMSLMNLSFYIWDDIIDKAPCKLLRSTLFGKFGEETALIVGGLASAKAFSILSQIDTSKKKRQTIANLFWDLWAKMAQAETASLRLQSGKNSSRAKLWKIKTEATDLRTCLRIGAVVGNGSENEVNHLGNYGMCLGIILELWKDFHVAVNLTLELAEKIRNGALPYSLLWASEHSEKIRKELNDVAGRKTLEPSCVRQIVKNTLETRALDNTLQSIRRYAKKAETELIDLKKNYSAQTLQFFVDAQPRLFVESLSALQV
jgi:geranylgeranyl pyrophosphate synthase